MEFPIVFPIKNGDTIDIDATCELIDSIDVNAICVDSIETTFLVTPLIAICFEPGPLEHTKFIIHRLLARGADINKSNLNPRAFADFYEESKIENMAIRPIQAATVPNFREDLISFLLTVPGINLNFPYNGLIACILRKKPNVALIKSLIRANAPYSVYENETALSAACKLTEPYRYEIMTALFEKGISPNGFTDPPIYPNYSQIGTKYEYPIDILIKTQAPLSTVALLLEQPGLFETDLFRTIRTNQRSVQLHKLQQLVDAPPSEQFDYDSDWFRVLQYMYPHDQAIQALLQRIYQRALRSIPSYITDPSQTRTNVQSTIPEAVQANILSFLMPHKKEGRKSSRKNSKKKVKKSKK